MGRRVAHCAVALAVAGALTGCSVEVGGVVGLTVGPNGDLVAVVAVCDGYLDGLSVYQGGGSEERKLGSWQRQEPIVEEAELSLAGPSSEWTTKQPLGRLPQVTELSVYGWTVKNRWSAVGPTFAAEDLAGLRSGEVWFEQYDQASDRNVNAFVPRSDFRREAC